MNHHRDELNGVSLALLSEAPNWQARYRQLIQWGSQIQPKPWLRKQEHRVPGCESATWLAHDEINKRFDFDSDSQIIKGLGALLLSLVDAHGVNGVELASVLESSGLRRHLSPSRSNGLLALMRRMEGLYTNEKI